MPSKVSAARQALDMLRFNVDADSDKLMAHIAEVDDKRERVFADAHKSVDQMHGDLGDINDDLTDLAGANGGPSLKGSSGSSAAGASPAAKPDGSVAETATAAATSPTAVAAGVSSPAQPTPATAIPKLTTNGATQV